MSKRDLAAQGGRRGGKKISFRRITQGPSLFLRKEFDSQGKGVRDWLEVEEKKKERPRDVDEGGVPKLTGRKGRNEPLSGPCKGKDLLNLFQKELGRNRKKKACGGVER